MLILRRLRGILTTALLWAVAWAVVAPLIFLFLALLFDSPWPLRRLALSALYVGLVAGAGAGALFASALMLAEQTRKLQALSKVRLAIWGALAGSWWYVLVALQTPWTWNPAQIGPFWVAMALTAGAGSLSGLTTVWLARRARDLPETTDDSPELGPSSPSHPTAQSSVPSTTRAR